MTITTARRFGSLITAAWFLAAAAIAAPSATRPSIDLNGKWEFRTDPEAAGQQEQWHLGRTAFSESISVPGCWQAQGIGKPSGILRHHYAGAAWYRKAVAVPAAWEGRRVVLRIGGALRDTDLFVNGTPAGHHSGMSAPFEFDVTGAVRAGRENVFVLRVAIPKGSPDTVSPDAQAGAEPTGMLNYIGNWGGLYGNVKLEATAPAWIDGVAATPDIARMRTRFRISIRSAEAGTAYAATLRVTVGREGGSYTSSVPVEVRPGTSDEHDVELPMPGARLWSPEDPFLYTAGIALEANGAERDRVSQRFGVREIATRGDVLLLNGKPLYLRGFGDDNIEVLTGTPPASKEVYLKRLRAAKDLGFNAVRFHSMTPVTEYFEAADETGILVMAELPAAYTMYFLPHKEFLRGELKSILRAHRNHPSFLSLALGNELNSTWVKDEGKRKQFFEMVSEFYKLAKEIDPARIVMSNDGVMLRPSDMMSLYDGAAKDVPTVRHEFGTYYCSLPDISLIDKFTGVVEPVWLQAKKRWVEKNGLAEAYPAYVRNSAALQHLGHKYEIEKVRLDNEVTGYTYWLIVDYPGGTGEGDSWEEGWLDYFWNTKGIRPEEARELNSAVLPLIDAGPGDRTLWADTGKTVGVFVSNYGDRDIRNGTLSWRLTSEGRVLQGSQLSGVDVPLGKVARAGAIEIRNLPGDEARQLELVVDLKAGDSLHTNRWNFWSFPRSALLKQSGRPVFSTVKWAAIERIYPFISPFISPQKRDWSPESVVVASALDRDTRAFLEAGGTVLLLSAKGQMHGEREITYLPQRGGALGTMIQDHPALRGFPHGAFCDLNFFNLLEGSGAVPLENLGNGELPIIGGIRTAAGWLSETKDLARVAQMFEARVGRGRLLATTLRIRENFDEAFPEAVYLFDRLLRYALSPEFAPKAELSSAQLEKLARQ